MAYSNLHSNAGSSSIEKLEACLADDNMSLLDAFEMNGIFTASASATTSQQHREIGTNTSLSSSCSSSRCSRYSTTSEQSVSYLSSRRSSYDTVSPFSIADDNDTDQDEDQYETFECFDYTDEEKKRPPSSDDDDEDEADENGNKADILPGKLISAFSCFKSF